MSPQLLYTVSLSLSVHCLFVSVIYLSIWPSSVYLSVYQSHSCIVLKWQESIITASTELYTTQSSFHVPYMEPVSVGDLLQCLWFAHNLWHSMSPVFYLLWWWLVVVAVGCRWRTAELVVPQHCSVVWLCFGRLWRYLLQVSFWHVVWCPSLVLRSFW